MAVSREPKAVMITTGRSGRLTFSSAQKSIPVFPGMLRSVRTTSNFFPIEVYSMLPKHPARSGPDGRDGPGSLRAAHTGLDHRRQRVCFLLVVSQSLVFPRCPASGKKTLKRLPSPWRAGGIDPSTVFFHDSISDRKTETGPLTNLLGGEKRIENMRKILRQKFPGPDLQSGCCTSVRSQLSQNPDGQPCLHVSGAGSVSRRRAWPGCCSWPG